MRATNPGTWTEPAQAPVLPSMKQVAAIRSSNVVTSRVFPPPVDLPNLGNVAVIWVKSSQTEFCT